MARAAPALLLALAACTNEYHPEYHPETVYSYVQTIKVEEPRPQLAPTIVVVMSPPPPPVAPRAFAPHSKAHVVDAAAPAPTASAAPPAFQAAPVFVADDRGQ